jgi:hypothetical protein
VRAPSDVHCACVPPQNWMGGQKKRAQATKAPASAIFKRRGAQAAHSARLLLDASAGPATSGSQPGAPTAAPLSVQSLSWGHDRAPASALRAHHATHDAVGAGTGLGVGAAHSAATMPPAAGWRTAPLYVPSLLHASRQSALQTLQPASVAVAGKSPDPDNEAAITPPSKRLRSWRRFLVEDGVALASVAGM